MAPSGSAYTSAVPPVTCPGQAKTTRMTPTGLRARLVDQTKHLTAGKRFALITLLLIS
jgi:hypothetical protein